MADLIRLTNLTDLNLSFDVQFDDQRIWRRVLLPYETTDELTGLATIDEIRRQPIFTAWEDDKIAFYVVSDDPTLGREHVFVVTPERATLAPGQGPTPYAHGNMVVLNFTVNVDAAHRIIKIPSVLRDHVTMHAHWCKSQHSGQAGKTVRWEIAYTIINGYDEDASGTTGTIYLDDTCTDNGVDTHVVHRTPDVAVTGLVPGDYLLLKIRAVTPLSGTPLDEPSLMAVDLYYDAYINRPQDIV